MNKQSLAIHFIAKIVNRIVGIVDVFIQSDISLRYFQEKINTDILEMGIQSRL